MRPQTIDDKQLVDALSDVFSRFGYEGANLNRLAEASGLKRASLYHRFPGGKDEIVAAVAARAGERFEKLLAPAYEKGEPSERAEQVAAGISDYYEDGARSCLCSGRKKNSSNSPSINDRGEQGRRRSGGRGWWVCRANRQYC